MKNPAFRLAVLAAALLICLLLAACGRNGTEDWKQQDGTLDVLDTGKSDCLLLRMDGQVFLIDAADADDESLIRQYLDFYGITRIDYLILTHYDNDHVGSAAAIVRAYEVGVVLGPDYRRDSARMRDLADALENRGLVLEYLAEDRTLETDNGEVWINVTKETVDLTDESEENNESLILSVRCGDNRLLLLGDALKSRTAEFNTLTPGAAYDLVKLPHHGDWNKALGVLLENALPRAAVVCAAAEENVESKLTEKCAALGIRLYGTYQGGCHVCLDGTLTVTQGKF